MWTITNSKTSQVMQFDSEEGAKTFWEAMVERNEHRDWTVKEPEGAEPAAA